MGCVNHTFASGAEHSLNQGVGRYMNLGMGCVCVNYTSASGAEHSLNQGMGRYMNLGMGVCEPYICVKGRAVFESGVGRYMNLGMGVCGAVLRAGSWVVQGYKERRKCFI